MCLRVSVSGSGLSWCDVFNCVCSFDVDVWYYILYMYYYILSYTILFQYSLLFLSFLSSVLPSPLLIYLPFLSSVLFSLFFLPNPLIQSIRVGSSLCLFIFLQYSLPASHSSNTCRVLHILIYVLFRSSQYSQIRPRTN